MSLQAHTHQLVLASASTVRATLLKNAGLAFDIVPADIDEAAIRSILGQGTDPMAPADIAVMLAQAKAVNVSEHHPDALVIGADQILVADGEIYTKPTSKAQARDQLVSLRGKKHSLISAVACAQNGQVDWYHEDTALLSMREFSNEFLGGYLAAVGNDALSSVGAYQLEGPGAQLFSSIDGDYFTVLGLPLITLLGYLRTQNIIID